MEGAAKGKDPCFRQGRQGEQRDGLNPWSVVQIRGQTAVRAHDAVVGDDDAGLRAFRDCLVHESRSVGDTLNREERQHLLRLRLH